ncbi:MAG: 2-oxoacid:acceptor oxidoreductase family protein [Coriobacteriales bacterium]|jgi:2-oxoglutarate ferredoxin oxidoreductase subunit gamma
MADETASVAQATGRADDLTAEPADVTPAEKGAPRRELRMVFAGFGGQGILFAGKLIAYAGLEDDRQLSWMPSYGPEMRGGTASCSVTLSDEPIGSPLVLEPDVLVALNQPSLEKYAPRVEPGGIVIANTTLCPDLSCAEARATDGVTTIGIPATELAEANGMKGLANIICVGRLWAATRLCPWDKLQLGLEHCVPPRKAHLLEPNRRALRMGATQR